MKKFIYLIAFACSMLTFSCSDPCDDTACVNGSTCVDGTCICTVGYSGTNCEIENRSSFLGTWGGVAECPGEPSETGTTVITESADGVDRVVLDVNGSVVDGIVTSPTTIDIPAVTQEVFGFVIVTSGNAVISGSELTVTLNVYLDGDGPITCTFVGSM